MIREVIELLNKVSDIQIIPAYTVKKLPQKPFATFSQLILNSKDFFGSDTEEKAEDDSLIEKKIYREIVTVQFDVYGNDEIETLKKAKELKELILFKLRYHWGNLNVGIAGFSDTKILNELIQEKYEYRNSFDIKFEYLVNVERKIELAKVIDFIVEKFKGADRNDNSL